MRSRQWRRDIEKQKVITRLKTIGCMYRYGLMDANDKYITDYLWMDLIGTHSHFMYKTYTTKYSKYKSKWGKRGYRSWCEGQNRISDKKLFKKMLQNEYDIKFFNISYGFIQNNTAEERVDNIE